jgi:hypothetical protein
MLAGDLLIRNGAGDDHYAISDTSAPGSTIRIVDGAGADSYFVFTAGLKVHVTADTSDPQANDSFNGGGTGTISYAATTQGITLQLEANAFGKEIGQDYFSGFTRAIGGSGNDTMYTNFEKGGVLCGGAGDDVLDGFKGNDILKGGDGWDNISDFGGFARIDTGAGMANVIISVTGGIITLGDGENLLELRNDTEVCDGRYVVTLNSLDNGIHGTDEDETFILKGEGIATVDLRRNGTVITANDLLTVNGDLGSTNETVKLTGSADRFVQLESANYQGIDRFITGSGNDMIFGSHTTYNALASGSGDDAIDCNADKTDVTAGRGDDLVNAWSGASYIDMGNGIDRVFCRGGSSTVVFNATTAKAQDQLYVFDFHKGTDAIHLDASTDAAIFLASGHEASLSDMQGLQFVTASGAMLFIGGLTAADLDAGLFV